MLLPPAARNAPTADICRIQRPAVAGNSQLTGVRPASPMPWQGLRRCRFIPRPWRASAARTDAQYAQFCANNPGATQGRLEKCPSYQMLPTGWRISVASAAVGTIGSHPRRSTRLDRTIIAPTITKSTESDASKTPSDQRNPKQRENGSTQAGAIIGDGQRRGSVSIEPGGILSHLSRQQPERPQPAPINKVATNSSGMSTTATAPARRCKVAAAETSATGQPSISCTVFRKIGGSWSGQQSCQIATG
jgi:hypothetical protein